MIQTELAIVGAGPAGLSAAIEARRAGADVLLIDENSRPGGQLFKQIHKFFGSRAHKAGTRGMNIGTQLLKESEELGIRTCLKGEVCGIEDGQNLWVVIDRNRSEIVKAKKIILATGATENAVAFPGWDLPGVMGAGAAQTMINVNRVLPGKKVLMLGSGNVGVIYISVCIHGGNHGCNYSSPIIHHLILLLIYSYYALVLNLTVPDEPADGRLTAVFH
jgi:NADPH-dependent 2,4-dienoyl-CoA reductase/sulfur reductase-like enzyme